MLVVYLEHTRHWTRGWGCCVQMRLARSREHQPQLRRAPPWPRLLLPCDTVPLTALLSFLRITETPNQQQQYPIAPAQENGPLVAASSPPVHHPPLLNRAAAHSRRPCRRRRPKVSSSFSRRSARRPRLCKVLEIVCSLSNHPGIGLLRPIAIFGDGRNFAAMSLNEKRFFLRIGQGRKRDCMC